MTEALHPPPQTTGERQLVRAKQRIAILERMIEDTTRDLYQSNEELRDANGYLTHLYRVLPGALLVIEHDGVVRDLNEAAAAMLRCSAKALRGRDAALVSSALARLSTNRSQVSTHHRFEDEWTQADGGNVPVLVSYARAEDRDGHALWVVFGVDIRERRALEMDLRHAQKLESVGQLAAGVAHEINTPMQFIGDNVHFLQEAFADLMNVVDVYAGALDGAAEALSTDVGASLNAVREQADLDYLRERAPRAFERTLEGIARVSSIVAAMKAFAHPQEAKAPADLNACVMTTLTVARNEYKYIAHIETDLGTLPEVQCHAGDVNQVLLNLVVNAAHAIDEKKTRASAQPSDGGMGTIRVRSWAEHGYAVVAVSDTGDGIPPQVQGRIFEPFFTTKEVGKGTGQGLAICYSIVSEGHSGSLTFETAAGQGTTFFMRLPLDGDSDKEAS